MLAARVDARCIDSFGVNRVALPEMCEWHWRGRNDPIERRGMHGSPRRLGSRPLSVRHDPDRGGVMRRFVISYEGITFPSGDEAESGFLVCRHTGENGARCVHAPPQPEAARRNHRHGIAVRGHLHPKRPIEAARLANPKSPGPFGWQR